MLDMGTWPAPVLGDGGNYLWDTGQLLTDVPDDPVPEAAGPRVTESRHPLRSSFSRWCDQVLLRWL